MTQQIVKGPQIVGRHKRQKSSDSIDDGEPLSFDNTSLLNKTLKNQN